MEYPASSEGGDTGSSSEKYYCGHCRANVGKTTFYAHKKLYFDKQKKIWNPEKLQFSEVVESVNIEEANSEDESFNGDFMDVLEQDESVVSSSNDDGVNYSPALNYSSFNLEDSMDDIEKDDNSSESETELWFDEDTNVESFSETLANPKEHKLIKVYVMFLFMWQSLFRVSNAGIEILLKFFSILLEILAKVFLCDSIRTFAKCLPKSLYMAKKILNRKEDSFVKYASCPKCNTLFSIEQCKLQLPDKTFVSKTCDHVEFPLHPQALRRQPCGMTLMKSIKTSAGTLVLVPRNLYCYRRVIDSLQEMLQRPDFISMCELWRSRKSINGQFNDIYDGKVWADFLVYNGIPFLSVPYNFGLALNVDWFQPFRHTTYSIGVIYVAILNLPRQERYKPENIIIVGVIPGPHEPKIHINTFLTPLVSELNQLWQGTPMQSCQNNNNMVLVRAALLCIACDIPAARKVSGFVGPQAMLGCSKCSLSFPTAAFGEKPDYSNFNRSEWKPRECKHHLQIAMEHQLCTTLQARKSLERLHGVRYSVLTRLPYFDPPRMTIIDPMHNLFLGTAKYILNVWKEQNFLTPNDLQRIQTLVDSFVAPSDIGRIPLKIASGFADFTADQWKNWIIYYSLPSLKKCLPFRHYNLWQLFVKATHILCRRSITTEQLKEADEILLQFCQTYAVLYGKQYCTPNLHLHGHLASCVEEYGPVYSFWLFSFERMNGILGSYHTNNNAISLQLMRHFIDRYGYDFHNWPEEFKGDFFPLLSESNYCKGSLMQSTLESALSTAQKDIKALPPIHEIVFSTSEKTSLQQTLGPCYAARNFEVLAIYKRCGAISLGKFILGSRKSKFTTSSRVMVNKRGSERPQLAEIHYYFQCALTFPNGDKQLIWMAAISYFFEHQCRVWFGCPAEVWSKVTKPDISFIPISDIASRVVYVESVVNFGRIQGDQNVLIVIPVSAN